MIVEILSCLLIQFSPNPDTLLSSSCQQKGYSDSICAIFQTLHTAWQAEENYQKYHAGNYLSLSIFSENCLEPAAFEARFNTQLPASTITASSYSITVAKIPVESDTCTETVLIISFFKQDDVHLPLAIFRYNLTQNRVFYEFITPDTSYILDYPLPNQN